MRYYNKFQTKLQTEPFNFAYRFLHFNIVQSCIDLKPYFIDQTS